jgi:tetratricopeptide (TPR) repeat protein
MRDTGSGSGRRALRRLLAIALGGIVAIVAPLSSAAAQEDGVGGRWKVLVVPLQTEGLNSRFGEQIADLVIDGLREFPTHTAIPRSELKKACRAYGVKCEELNAITSRQLAAQLKAQMVMFGTVQPADRGFHAGAAFTNVRTGEEIEVPPIPIAGKDDAKKVAQAIVSKFEEAVNFERAKTFCQQYVGSNQPQNALENCDKALAINPRSPVALYHKGAAFRQLAETEPAQADVYYDSAIAYYTKVLEVQPGHKDALQSLAWVHSKKGDAQTAFRLYRDFLELDPRNATVRLAVSHDLAQNDLLNQAIQVLNEGIALDSTKLDLWQYKGDLALRLAQDSARYADTAIAAYQRVYTARGAEADTSLVTNLLASYAKAGRLEEALAFGQRALETHSGSASLWSQYALALSNAKNHAEAARAMTKTIEIDPEYANAYARRGLYHYYAGNEAAAHQDFRQAIAKGQLTADQLASNLFAEGYQAFTKQRDLERATRLYRAALEYCKDARRCSETHFFWGYALYLTGTELDQREDLRSIRRALELFEEAKPHIEKGTAARPQEAKKILEDLDVFIFREQQRIRQAQRSGG